MAKSGPLQKRLCSQVLLSLPTPFWILYPLPDSCKYLSSLPVPRWQWTWSAVLRAHQLQRGGSYHVLSLKKALSRALKPSGRGTETPNDRLFKRKRMTSVLLWGGFQALDLFFATLTRRRPQCLPAGRVAIQAQSHNRSAQTSGRKTFNPQPSPASLLPQAPRRSGLHLGD